MMVLGLLIKNSTSLVVRLAIALLLLSGLVPGLPSAYAQSGGESGMNPESILVSRYNFKRPADWKWVETIWDGPANVKQSVTIRAASDATGDCFAYINHFVPDRPAGSRGATADRWKESYINPPKNVSFGKQETIGTSKISYLEITGTYRPPGRKVPPRPNFSMYGAVIEDPEGNVVLRVMGPAALVREAKPEFKKMIEEALKEAQ